MNLTSSYSQLALDRVWQHSHDILELNYVDRKIPGVGDEGWLEYLQRQDSLLRISKRRINLRSIFGSKKTCRIVSDMEFTIL